MAPPLSTEFLTEFIELYRSQPCLWKIKSKDYSNRNLRENAYKELVNFCKTAVPEADKDFVIKKINNLRSAFRKELKKIKEVEHSGMGVDETYTPKLWYFNLLLFTADQEIGRETTDNLAAENINMTPAEEHETQQQQVILENVRDSLEIETNSEIGSNDDTNTDTTQRTSQMTSTMNKLKRKKFQKSDERNASYLKALETLNKPDDEFEHFGCTVAAKLRNMDAKQMIFTEHLINSALYLGQLGKLNEKYIIMEPTYSQNVNSCISDVRFPQPTQQESSPSYSQNVCFPPVQFSQPAQEESSSHQQYRQEIATNNPEVTQDGRFIQLQPLEKGMSFRVNDYFGNLRDSKK